VLVSAKDIGLEMGWTESYVLRNHRVSVWEKNTDSGKGRQVGKMYPGSHALILDETTSNDGYGNMDYKIKSPLDNSVGWINSIQIDKIILQNINTNRECQ